MKKIFLTMCAVLNFLVVYSQVYTMDFGTTNALYICNPPIYTLSGNNQCVDSVNFLTPVGKGIVYTTTTTGTNGLDCRNHLALVNPGFSFLGSGSELQLRNAGGGATPLNPARLTVKNFPGGTRFGIIFNFALIGRSGSFYFRCGNGESYGDTTYMLGRDSSSFVVLKFNDENPALVNPYMGYCNKANNLSWPSVPSYSWQQGATILDGQKHELALFCNNSLVPISYNYLGQRTLLPSSYDVYIDSVLDASNVFDDFFQNGRTINSFMFGGGNYLCSNGGSYFGDTLILDDIRWTTDIVNNPLPIHLSRFTGYYKNGYTTLTWRDETPADGVLVEIQKSIDGVHFASFASSTEQAVFNDYKFTWKAEECGKLFYRLLFEGKYSGIISVTVPCSKTVLTQVAKGVRINTPSGGAVSVYSLTGQEILSFPAAKGFSEYSLSSLPGGMYIVRFVGGAEAVSLKIVL